MGLPAIKRRIIIVVMCVLLVLMSMPLAKASQTTFAQGSNVVLNPTQGTPGTQVTGTGSNWAANDSILVQWDDGTTLANSTVGNDGTFTASFIVPTPATQGSHTISFTDQTAGYFIPATFTVTTSSSSFLTVEQITTSDTHGHYKTTFAPGDAIQYEAVVNNSSGNAITATFHYQAWGPNGNYIFDHTYPNAPVGVGVITYPVPTTIPNNAPSGSYTIRVGVADQNSSASDVKDGQFTVISSPTPGPTQSPTAIPTAPTTVITTQPTTPSTSPTSQVITLSQSSGTAGSTPVVFGTGFPPNSQIMLQWFPPGSSTGQTLTTAPSPLIANVQGNFSTPILIPQNSPLGQGKVCASEANINTCTSFLVISVSPQAPEINSVDVSCEALLFAGAFLAFELWAGVGEVGCAGLGSLFEFWH
jgi:hypothetical protein